MYRVPQPWFDEAFAEGGGLRPAYLAMQRRTGWDPLRPSVSVAERLRDRPLGDDTRILPVPLVLEDAEYRAVQAGVAQRVRTLQRLFDDLVLGRQRILTAGIGPDRNLIDRILTMHGTSLDGLRELWRAADRERIRFVYAPDLVRDGDGRWLVLEDNVGCVGGTADSYFVAAMYRSATEPGEVGCRPRPDLALAVRCFVQRLGRDGVVAVLGRDGSTDPWAFRLDENARRRRILSELGIAVVDQEAIEGASVLVNFDVDLSWVDFFSRPGVAMLNAPGTGWLGNKALLPWLDDAIRFYTGEEPILSTPPTRPLDGALPPDPAGWVVKSAAGCQGSEVVVLGWQPPDRLPDVAGRVGSAVLQRYVEPSRLSPAGPGGWDSYRVEIRPIGYLLGWDVVQVGEQPLGKAISSYDARRLNNISRGACYVPVLREPCPWCR